ncbi:RHS repeat-associated protein [Lacibacter cauensis]|uniref:RHS repeat-associated protein n=1 Tax=Lacibacter cauensis TaxID=510947 RepID=A0A562SWW1_9BACT|nr:RHS repeat-associated core domain-containing protein [Lacibacter cauensis]TWI85732.1 RHS repeat-associated protein [Lacibacter cauensis]
MQSLFLRLLVCLLLTTKISHAQVPVPADQTGSADLNINWIRLKAYSRITNNVVNDGKSFFDQNGKVLQTQSKVKYKLSNGQVVTHVFASQPLYDVFGRPAAQTMPAPINAGEFKYTSTFVSSSSGTTYNYKNFDRFNSGSVESDKTKVPDAVGTQSGTLGWYYSTNNNWEPYTPTTSYPYSRQTFYRDGTGAAKEIAGPGDQLRMGLGRIVTSYTTGIQNELQHYLQVRNQYFTTAELGEMPNYANKYGVQVINRDANGREGVVIVDSDGKSLVTGRPGASGSGNLTVSNIKVLGNWAQYRYIFNGFFENSSALPGYAITGGTVKVYTSGDGVNFTLSYTGPASGVGGNNLIRSYYKIESNEFFTVNTNSTVSGATTVSCLQCSAEPITHDIADVYLFKLFSAGVVTITGGAYQLYNMGNDEELVSFTSGNILAAGYYKLVAIGDPVTVSYSNTYTDLSYYFYNQLGQKVATIAPEGVKMLIQNGLNGYTKITVPFISLYEYNEQGQLVNAKDADIQRKGEVVYRRDGKLRFSQSAEQWKTGRYSYTNYDQWGRVIESGEYQPDLSTGITFTSDMSVSSSMKSILASTDQTGGLVNGIKHDVVITKYDVADNSHGLGSYVQNEYFLRNAVSYTEKLRDAVLNNNYAAASRISRTWYNYDEEGNVLWMIQGIDGVGNKTIDYTYDLDNRLIKVIYEKDNSGETFVHYYTYNDAGRLLTISTNITDNIGTATLQATYQYYLHGPLKRKILNNNLQGIDYTYTLGGQIKAINNAQNNPVHDPGQDGNGNGVFADAFGMTLDYYNGDYNNNRSGIVPIKQLNVPSGTASDLFTGQVKAMTWFSQKPASVSGMNDPTSYIFTYDDKYQFTESTWGNTLSFNNGTSNPASFTSTNLFKERVMQPGNNTPAYDRNGNIQYLQRTGNMGQETDKFQYNYIANTNKLQSITESASTGPTGTYATYSYDDDGQLIQETPGSGADAGGVTRHIKYDVTGKIVGVYADAAFTQAVVSFEYNERGQRISKTIYNSSTYQPINKTFYLSDAAGNEAAIYSQSKSGMFWTFLSLQEQPIYGRGREGVYYRPSNITAYELQDQLGNVRAVVARNGSTLETRMYSDYYPFGFVIRRAGTNDYRYGYQGGFAEEDKETGWNAFELRMYDSRIARWLSVDPEGEFWSPYVGMGNDPVNNVDPTGGCIDCEKKAREYAKKHGGTVSRGSLKGSYLVTTVENGSTIFTAFSPKKSNKPLQVNIQTKLKMQFDFPWQDPAHEALIWDKKRFDDYLARHPEQQHLSLYRQEPIRTSMHKTIPVLSFVLDTDVVGLAGHATGRKDGVDGTMWDPFTGSDIVILNISEDMDGQQFIQGVRQAVNSHKISHLGPLIRSIETNHGSLGLAGTYVNLEEALEIHKNGGVQISKLKFKSFAFVDTYPVVDGVKYNYFVLFSSKGYQFINVK